MSDLGPDIADTENQEFVGGRVGLTKGFTESNYELRRMTPKTSLSYTVHEAFPGEIALFLLRNLMLRTFDTKQAVAEGRIH